MTGPIERAKTLGYNMDESKGTKIRYILKITLKTMIYMDNE